MFFHLALALSPLVGFLAGSASAFFLHSLEAVTRARESHPQIIWALPLAGFALALLYQHYGKKTERGNDLILDHIHDPQVALPLRLAPLILGATLFTHLFGGSAGREGTAVQMAAGLADPLSRRFARLRTDRRQRRILLLSALSAGFGSIFGTPWAGMFFGLEIPVAGHWQWDALPACFIASWIGHWTCVRLWHVQHEHISLRLGEHPFTAQNILWLLVLGLAVGLASRIFVGFLHGAHHLFEHAISSGPWRAASGGAIVIALAKIVPQGERFLGLSLPTLQKSLDGPIGRFDFFWKSLFTAVTLGSGFKGGEVTPLFFVGAATGNSFAQFFHLYPLPLFSGLGFSAIFSAAAQTPLTGAFVAAEFFGWPFFFPGLIVALVGYFTAARRGLYPAQKGREKSAWHFVKGNIP